MMFKAKLEYNILENILISEKVISIWKTTEK